MDVTMCLLHGAAIWNLFTCEGELLKKSLEEKIIAQRKKAAAKTSGTRLAL
jgi:hypothetical protein